MTTQLRDFDHHSPDLTEDAVWQEYGSMRAGCPVAHTPNHGGYWVLTRYADVKAAARDPETFSSAGGIRIPSVGAGRSIPIDVDPPLHTDYRRLFTHAINPGRVRELRPFLHALIEELLDGFAATGGGDAVERVALPLPLRVLTALVGFSDETVAQLRRLTEQSWEKVTTASLDDARRDLRTVMEQEIARHRAERPDDYLSWLLDAQVGDRPITDDEIARILLTLAIAGHETTANAVGGLIHILVTDEDLQDRIRADPGLAPAFVEEVLRFRTPAQLFARQVTRDVEVSGTAIPAGGRVLLAYAAADRDDLQFPQGDRFDLDRGGRGHLAFGWGIHQCVGAALARQELRLLMEKLCRLPRIRAAGAAAFGPLQGGIHLGPRALPVRFES
jgi:cytochrome P450